jgi:HPt (histidine-containing phosphotransfer) domain-containing protein
MPRVRHPLDKYQALVSKRLLDLIPGFLRNRRSELESLRQALAANDFQKVCELAHRMRGVGGSYGFDYVTTLGRRIEDCARKGDAASLADLVRDYADYLANVRVEYA